MVFNLSSIFMGNTEIDMKNKLFCSFTAYEFLPEAVATITSRYSILYNKLFVLESPQTTEYLITYNIDTDKPLDIIPENTILLHRKKESNTLYTINALNTLVKSLNEGKTDPNFKITWADYSNSVLLTQGDDLRIINTKIFKILYL